LAIASVAVGTARFSLINLLMRKFRDEF